MSFKHLIGFFFLFEMSLYFFFNHGIILIKKKKLSCIKLNQVSIYTNKPISQMNTIMNNKTIKPILFHETLKSQKQLFIGFRN